MIDLRLKAEVLVEANSWLNSARVWYNTSMKQTILITGGGGYIGSHAVKLFLAKGYNVVIFDNFAQGFREVTEVLAAGAQPGQLTVVEGDLRDYAAVDQLLAAHPIDAVLHFAALCSVDESTKKPELYLHNNVIGSINLFRAMLAHDVKTLVFSSTCAVYNGMTAPVPITEAIVPDPLNAYGESKWMIERAIKWLAATHDWHYVIFRYFNVCGAASDGSIGDSKHPSVHLMQNAVRGAMGIEPFYFTFQPMDTPDGSPIRDYVDVEDLVDAHFQAYEYLRDGGANDTFNLGNGTGYSVKQIADAVEAEFGITLERRSDGAKRSGESARAFADPTHVRDVLGWKPRKSLQDSIRSLRRWYEGHPQGWKN